ncbi:hypothetical protein SARC_18020, partial [Sphaeroforma arctica JP610]
KKWWKDAADPFQCLAACIDLTDAYKLDDPTEHLSYLPVHQVRLNLWRGTCI